MENEQATPKKTACNEMRKAWFDYVRKTRAKLSRGKKEKCSHRDAMKAASEGLRKGESRQKDRAREKASRK